MALFKNTEVRRVVGYCEVRGTSWDRAKLDINYEDLDTGELGLPVYVAAGVSKDSTNAAVLVMADVMDMAGLWQIVQGRLPVAKVYWTVGVDNAFDPQVLVDTATKLKDVPAEEISAGDIDGTEDWA